jgi:hypothetical protein
MLNVFVKKCSEIKIIDIFFQKIKKYLVFWTE